MYKTALSLVLSAILSLSLSLVGCGNDAVDTQVPQQQEQVNKKEQTKALIIEDLEFYNEIASQMADATQNIDTKSDCENSYIMANNLLEELRNYENCPETTEAKGYLANAIINSMEIIDCIYQEDVYGGNEALTSLDINLDKFDQECDRLVEEYGGDNTETYN